MLKTPDHVAAGVRTELRGILRRWANLAEPLTKFEAAPGRNDSEPRFWVSFDNRPRRSVIGLRSGMKSLTLPDEHICDDVLQLAGSVWHLKDWLKRWCEASAVTCDVEGHARQHIELLVCADLINAKKHGENKNRSGLQPTLSDVTFDLARCTPVELFYDGACRIQEVLVTKPEPISYRVDVLTSGAPSSLGDAVEYIRVAFERWLPLVQQTGVISDDHPEAVALRQHLVPTLKPM